MNIFRRRPIDPTEDALRRLSKTLGWARPTLDDAPGPTEQLGHLARRLCEGIDRDEPTETVTALRVIEDLLATEAAADATSGAEFDPGHWPEVDQTLSLSLVEPVSNWCSWPETPERAVAAVEGALGPLARARWEWIREQALDADRWLDAAGTRSERALTPAAIRGVENADLRFQVRSSHQYLDETKAVGLADRLRFEKSAGA